MLYSEQHLIMSHAECPHMAWKFPVSPMDCHLREDKDCYMLLLEVSPVLTDSQHLAPGWCSTKNIVQCMIIESVLDQVPVVGSFGGPTVEQTLRVGPVSLNCCRNLHYKM